MSQAQVAAYPHPQYVMLPIRETNGLGIAGFFIAIVGLFIPTGIVALLGMLISLVALGKAPRGFAGMGVVVGLLGTVLWLAIMGIAILGAVAVGVVAMVAGAAAFILTQPEIIEVTSDMLNVTIAAVEYEDENKTLPEELDDLGLSVSTRTDPWGNPYRYVIVEDEPGFDVISAGSDGIMGTGDDLKLSRIDEVWENAFESFGQKMEEFGQKMERLQNRSVRFQRASQHGWGQLRLPGCDGSPRRSAPVHANVPGEGPVPADAPAAAGEPLEARIAMSGTPVVPEPPVQ